MNARSQLVQIITSTAPETRDRSLDAFCRSCSLQTLMEEKQVARAA